MSFTLSAVPGFRDTPDANFASGQPSIARLIASIAGNASQGMCRTEIFPGTYVDGDTVALPISTIDGYNYERDELLYVWCVGNTMQLSSKWASGPGSLWYGLWKVDQTTGDVSCEEFYRNSHSGLDGNSADTADGVLTVFTIAQRGTSTLLLAASPSYTDHAASDFAQDKPLNQSLMQNLNNNAKFGVIGQEVIYMGEFTNGQTVSRPVSPADGYTYTYSECAFMHSWRWTSGTSTFAIPINSNRQLDDISASVDSATGLMSVAVTYKNDTTTGTVSTTDGRVAVFAFCQRKGNNTDFTFSMSASSSHWGQTGGTNSSLLFRAGDVLYWNKSSQTVPASAALVWTWQDGSNAVIGSPISLTGTTPMELVAPVGTAKGGIGFQTGTTATGSVTILWSMRNLLALAATATAFAELSEELIVPGNTMRASTLLQLNKNSAQAAVSPEFFGPTDYTNGQTIPVPTSAVDGYTYARAELLYICEWRKTGDGTAGASDIRIVIMNASVNGTTGVVTTQVYRLPSGGTPTLTNDGTLRVLVVAQRAAQFPIVTPAAPTAPTGQPPSDGLPSPALSIEGAGVSYDKIILIEGVGDGSSPISISIEGSADGG